jgi:hypothetical protein
MKRSFKARNFEVINDLQHVFEKQVERCKNFIACQGKFFEKDTVTAPPKGESTNFSNDPHDSGPQTYFHKLFGDIKKFLEKSAKKMCSEGFLFRISRGNNPKYRCWYFYHVCLFQNCVSYAVLSTLLICVVTH